MDLVRASQDGNLERVKEILSLGISINLRNGTGDTALICASRFGTLAMVKELLVLGGATGINLRNREGDSALKVATKFDRLEIVKLLLAVDGASSCINLQNWHGETVLMRASLFGQLEIVKLLLEVENGAADVNLQDQHGDTALFMASRFRHLEIAKELVRKGARIDGKSIRMTCDRDFSAMLEEWSDDKRMLSKLTLQRRCWLTILINKIDYTKGIPPIIVHILNGIWLESSCEDSSGTCVWAQGYIIRMRKKF